MISEKKRRKMTELTNILRQSYENAGYRKLLKKSYDKLTKNLRKKFAETYVDLEKILRIFRNRATLRIHEPSDSM